MPTREILASFWRDWDRLTSGQQRAFRQAVVQFIADLSSGSQGFHPHLRVKRVQGHPGVWEMTWAYDGCATFNTATRFTPASRTSSGVGLARTRSFNRTQEVAGSSPASSIEIQLAPGLERPSSPQSDARSRAPWIRPRTLTPAPSISYMRR
jgi:hypothetical protein